MTSSIDDRAARPRVVPMHADWWPEIAERLPLPWPREAVLTDLRWWTTQGRIPCIDDVLAPRWGWKQLAARLMVRSREWHERSFPPPQRPNLERLGVRPSAATPRNGPCPPSNNRDIP